MRTGCSQGAPQECTEHASSAALADFQREAELLQSMRHPFILNFLGACFDSAPVRTGSRMLWLVWMLTVRASSLCCWHDSDSVAPACADDGRQ